MELNGKPFVPPTCPADQYGAPIIPSPDQFNLVVYDDEHYDPKPRPTTELMGYFGNRDGAVEGDDCGDKIETDVVELSRHSNEARQARKVDGNKEAVRRMGALLCERVINCRGVVDGECWALGPRAVIEVLREADDDTISGH